MIAIILSCILLLLIFFSYGNIALQVWNKIAGLDNLYTTIDRIWIGICSVGIILLYISIFLPLNIWVLAFLTVIALLHLVWNRKEAKSDFIKLKKHIISFPFWGKLILVLAFSSTLLYSLCTPLIYDEGLYHLQAMQWTERFGTIWGLGNLHGRLGFNSSFLLLSTVFNYHPDSYLSIFTINSLALSIFSFWLIKLIFRTDASAKSIVPLVFVLLTSLFSLGANASSTSTDILPNIFILYILISWALNKDFVKSKPLLLAMMSIFCITLKLSSAVILVATLVCIVSLFRERKPKVAYMVFALGIVVAIPWLVRFFLLTGYLVYPFPSIDVFSVDWKIPLEMVTLEKDIAYAWARVPYMEAKEVLAMSLWEWMPLWIDSLSIYKLLIYALAVISPLFLLIWRTNKGVTPWAIAFVGALFGIFTAPDFRFGFGFLIAATTVPFLLPSKQKKQPALHSLTKGVLTVGLLGLLFIASAQLNNYQQLSSESCFSLLLKPQSTTLLAKEQTYKEYKINNTTIFVPLITNQCFDTALPCAPYYNSNLQMRGEDITDGFRIKK